MPDIHCCTAQISSNQVTEGYYTLDDGVLTMVYADGRPVEMPAGGHKTHRMRPGDDAASIARVLTKEIRTLLRGEVVPGFWRELPTVGGVA